jgi:hypothetical protein
VTRTFQLAGYAEPLARDTSCLHQVLFSKHASVETFKNHEKRHHAGVMKIEKASSLEINIMITQWHQLA